MADKTRSPGRSAAIFSMLAPVIAFGVSRASSVIPVQTHDIELLAGGAAALFILAGIVLAMATLVGSLRHRRRRVAVIAAAGLGINGLCLLGPTLLTCSGFGDVANWDPLASWAELLPSRPGPRAGTAAQTPRPPAEMPVAPGGTEIRTLPGEVARDPRPQLQADL